MSDQDKDRNLDSTPKPEEKLAYEDTTVHKDCITQEKQTQSTEKDEKYVVLMETSGEECESWYYCIRYRGNEENLHHLQKQLETVDWYILDDLSTFDLDLDHFISEKTAKELTKLELNHHSFHRKFDGVLDRIELNLRKRDKNEKKMVKVFDILGYGQIEDYIDGEDLDDEDLTDTPQSSSEEESSEDEEDEEDEGESENNENDSKQKRKKGIPEALRTSNLPRFARAKRRTRRNI